MLTKTSFHSMAISDDSHFIYSNPVLNITVYSSSLDFKKIKALINPFEFCINLTKSGADFSNKSRDVGKKKRKGF